VIGVENITYAPYYTILSDGEYGAFSRDVFNLFAKKNNINIKFEPLSVARLFKEFFSGNIEFNYPDSELWQKEDRVGKTIFYSDNVVDYIDGIIIKTENKTKDISFIKTLGTIRGFEIGVFKEKRINVVESSSIQDLIEKLYNDKVDAVYFNVAVALNYVNENKVLKNKLFFKKDFPYSMGYYKLSSNKNKEFIDKFNLFLKKNKKEIKELKNKNKIIF
jgi:ABC-type amino acid transport substrate-binding protein